MKKKTLPNRKLNLNRDTLRALETSALGEAAGAATHQNSCDPISALRCPGSAQTFCEGC